MTGGAILALLWSLGMGLVWVAGLGMAPGCAVDPEPPTITVTPYCQCRVPHCEGVDAYGYPFCECGGAVCYPAKVDTTPSAVIVEVGCCRDVCEEPGILCTGIPPEQYCSCIVSGARCDAQCVGDSLSTTLPSRAPFPNIRPPNDPSRGGESDP